MAQMDKMQAARETGKRLAQKAQGEKKRSSAAEASERRMLAAREAQERIASRLREAAEQAATDPSQRKMEAARKLWETRLEKSGFPRGKECVVKADRFQGDCKDDPSPPLREQPQFRALSSHWLRRPPGGQFQAYGRAQWFENRHSNMKVSVESERREGWLAPYRITVCPDDRTGLLPADIFPILKIVPDFKISTMEVALDFLNLTRQFVLRRFLSGKSALWPMKPGVGFDHWGNPRTKLVRGYFKWEISAYRIELQMRSRFLLKHGIAAVADFWKFVDLLPVRHVFFGTINEQKLITWLRRGRGASETLRILRRVNDLEGNLHAQLTYLRREVGLQNTRRLLIPHPLNEVVRHALTAWAAMWPKNPKNK